MAKMMCIIAAVVLVSAYATNEASASQASSMAAVEAMSKVAFRSNRAHTESMTNIMHGMTNLKAWKVLEKHNLTTPALLEMNKKSHLRKQPKGYGGLDGARKLLNDMIFESMTKYDAEIAKCTEYYSSQCAAMEGCRGQIAASNYIAANSRSLILDAQSTINRCQADIPVKKQELSDHNDKCHSETTKMKTRLGVIEADIAVMTVILKMTDCEKKSFVDMKKLALLRCEDKITGKSDLTFNHDDLEEQVSQLKSHRSQSLLQDTFSDLFQGVESMASIGDCPGSSGSGKKTKLNKAPMPRTKIAGNPCNDPNGGAPSVADKRAAKCTIKKSPQCYKLQERFLLIQSGIKDERDALLEAIAEMEKNCKETKETLEEQISNDEDSLSNAQTKLASATEKEATAGEVARQTAAENEQYEKDLKKQMKACSGNYINFETELCALKKIRGELYKMAGGGSGKAFFQDCEVSVWDPEECTKKCHRKQEAYGEQKLTRGVMTHPNKGAKCLPLAAVKKCNMQPCPIDCKVAAWSGWSKCSAECGGGVQQRLREVKRAMKYGGKPCGETSETKACHAESCEADCVLSSWTRWSKCSKECDGGTRKRFKFVQTQPLGNGKCSGKWDPERLQYRKCNMKRCKMPAKPKAKTLTCERELDVVFLIDGSGSLGKKGWKAEIEAARMFVDAFAQKGSKANMAVVLYSGPRTWSGVRKCVGRNKRKVDMAKTCKIKSITHFTDDMKKVKQLITGLEWPRGSTLTSLALATAKAELSLGRKNAQSVVVVITDGRPLSYRNTYYAARSLRKSARLVWVPVTKYAPLRFIKRVATRRWQENVVQVKTFKALEKPDPINEIIANICPATKAEKAALAKLTTTR